MDYKQKYLKYKSKYLNLLKDQKGGKPFLSDILAQPAYLWLFIKNQKQLEYIFSQRPISFNRLLLENIRLNYYHRLSLISKSGLSLTLASRLVNQDRIAYRLAKHIISRLHNKIKEITALTCVATLTGHRHYISSVAFHQSLPLMATGSWDNTAKVWKLSADGTVATFLTTLVGHSNWVTSVAFHPSLPLLATGSYDKTAKLWRLEPDDGTATTCVATLDHRNGGHDRCVTSVAFHTKFPLLATGSWDNTAKVWRLSADGTRATCVSTLREHVYYVSSVAFHPRLPFMATGSDDMTAKVWRISPGGTKVTCITTLILQKFVFSVAFHPRLPLLATGSGEKTAKLWQLELADSTTASCIATLTGHKNSVSSVVFHPSLPFLATGSNDRIAKIWHLSADGTDVTNVATLEGHDGVIYIAFHPSLPLMATGGNDNNAKLWK